MLFDFQMMDYQIKVSLKFLRIVLGKYVDDQSTKRGVMAKDLCKYLGYSDRDGEVGLKEINSGVQILSGDLYCRENSRCCAHLNSSTSDINTKLPFVTCEHKEHCYILLLLNT